MMSKVLTDLVFQAQNYGLLLPYNICSGPFLFILRMQGPAFGLPQIKEFSRLFIEKANEVCLSIRVFACSSSTFSYGTP